MSRRSSLVALALLGSTALALPAHAAGYSVTADCTFVLVFDPNNQAHVVYGGTAVATGPAGSVAVATRITCEVTNVPSGGTSSAQISATLPGSAAAIVDVATPWPAGLPVTICTSAFAAYGPLGAATVTVPRTCKTPSA